MTLEELYNKVMSDRDIMAEFVKASSSDSLSAFAKGYGCNATDNEIRKYFLSQCGDQVQIEDEGELEDDALENVSGGSIFFVSWITSLFARLFGGFSSEPQNDPAAINSVQSSSSTSQGPKAIPMPAIGSQQHTANNALLTPGHSNYNATWC